MVDERKSSNWWQTIPGALTAVAAFLAAISGLLGGLNQIGVFDRFKHPATQPPVTGSVSRADSAAKHEARPPQRSATAPVRRAPAPNAGAGQPSAPPPDTSKAPASPAAAVIPNGAELELAAQSRVCSTNTKPGEHFAATVVVPVTGPSGVLVPVGSTAIMEATQESPPTFLGARADSLIVNGKAHPITGASIGRIQREFTAGPGERGVSVGTCIPAGGRIPVTLTAAVPLSP
jgi:hypothetical protein